MTTTTTIARSRVTVREYETEDGTSSALVLEAISGRRIARGTVVERGPDGDVAAVEDETGAVVHLE